MGTDRRRLVSQLSNCDTAHTSSRNSWPFLWASTASEVNQLNVIKENRPALSTGCWCLWWQSKIKKTRDYYMQLYIYIGILFSKVTIFNLFGGTKYEKNIFIFNNDRQFCLLKLININEHLKEKCHGYSFFNYIVGTFIITLRHTIMKQ